MHLFCSSRPALSAVRVLLPENSTQYLTLAGVLETRSLKFSTVNVAFAGAGRDKHEPAQPFGEVFHGKAGPW